MIRGQIVNVAYSDRQTISFTRELTETAPNKILFVIITLLIHPVDCNTLHAVFSRVGKVKKVVLQNKSVQLQGFVEMDDVMQAAEAKAQFNNKHIYASSCKMAIAFAKMGTLDCTDPSCSRDYSIHSPDEPMPSPLAVTQGQGQQAPGNPSQPAQPSIAYPGTQAYERLMGVPQDPTGAGSVLLVNHLDERVTPQELFNLFGTCGDVMKIKILFNKRDSGLLEFRNAAQARSAKEMLQGCPMYGRELHVVPSSKTTITIGNTRSPDFQDSGLSKEFPSSPFHRFKDDTSRQFAYIRAPAETLHVSNVPPHIDDQALKDLFAPYGVNHAELFRKKPTMATVIMNSKEAAVHALMALNGLDFGVPGMKPMYLSFAMSQEGGDPSMMMDPNMQGVDPMQMMQQQPQMQYQYPAGQEMQQAFTMAPGQVPMGMTAAPMGMVPQQGLMPAPR